MAEILSDGFRYFFSHNRANGERVWICIEDGCEVRACTPTTTTTITFTIGEHSHELESDLEHITVLEQYITNSLPSITVTEKLLIMGKYIAAEKKKLSKTSRLREFILRRSFLQKLWESVMASCMKKKRRQKRKRNATIS
ncbi:hypothetical protein GWI33_017181 [Rhynchophorus ferrugineus]|uniref:FLYWCH-type domain-containing protein n=1 Tax=Rhynchophorus ferrugineus TaxID=354439 RepID=A0A834HWH1_RHYFE|nr:hypothetical protein GWI33_017181 [Rhynchophorus ferrugineus]